MGDAALRLLITLIVASSIAIASPGNASAQPRLKMRAAGMYVTGIDEVQAARAGNRVILDGNEKVLVDGRTGLTIARVPALSTNEPTTQGVVHGDCGSSYLYMRDTGESNILEFTTGFDLTRGSAWEFDWYLVFDGPRNYSGRWEDHGPIRPSEHWTSGWKSDYTTDDGWHTGEVIFGAAFLTNGLICFSGLPSASAHIR